MPKLKSVSGETVVKILCNRFGFKISGRSGSHVRLSKEMDDGKIGTVVPMHDGLKLGTLKGVLKLAKVDPEEFAKYL
ncbi:MAG: type II toxin-antitoxin system HicA family toxin [Methanotrichaceae archaeon]|nr:type II toxin-antitoxin system HicA family toxin [Methanotrichaceae archaeon]